MHHHTPDHTNNPATTDEFIDERPTRCGGAVTRRTVLSALGGAALGGAAFGGAALGPATGPMHVALPAAAAPPPATEPARFAMLTDAHADVDTPDRTADLARVFAHITSRDPDFVLNCGDITDYGVDPEYQTYLGCLPDELASRVHHVPGNHATQWDDDAWETYRRLFGPTHYSFDAAGLHVIALDPLLPQMWAPWHFSDELLAWLEEDLAGVAAETPIVVFNHFPLTADWFFVDNSERFRSLIADHRVRVVYAGHIHRPQVRSTNGFTQIVGNAVKKAPVYYWSQRVTDEDGDRLLVSEVTVPRDGAPSESLLATVSLDDPGPGGQYGPFEAELSTTGSAVSIDVKVPADSRPDVVTARYYPQGEAGWPSWHHLERTGDSWTGSLTTAGRPPGEHRIQVRAGAGLPNRPLTPVPVWDEMRTVRIEGDQTVQTSWTHRLGASVMGDLAEHRGRVVAATTDGRVEMVVPRERGRGRGFDVRWRRDLTGCYKAPVFDPTGRTVFVGATDHHLYALGTGNGRVEWRCDLGAPVQCDPVVIAIDGRDHVVVAADGVLFCIERSGRVRWRADLGGAFTGQACSNGALVFAGSGDGYAYAFDARSGRQVWRTRCTEPDTAYHMFIWGPWAARMRMLPNGDVLVTTVSEAIALSADTGEARWRFGGMQRAIYTPPLVTDQEVLVFDGKHGDLHVLDPGTGTEIWSDETLPCSIGAGPVRTDQPRTLLMAANSGVLIRIDLDRRTVTELLQFSQTFTTSTAVLVQRGAGAGVLVSANHDGDVVGIVGAV